jgi:hypothetical protein
LEQLPRSERTNFAETFDEFASDGSPSSQELHPEWT